jgi:hypothetical protein
VRFFFGDSSMLNAFWNDVHFAGLQLDRMVSHLDLEHTLEYEEEVIGVSVAMPYELALDFDDHEVVPVEQADGSWTPVFSERVQFRCEVYDLVLHCVDGLILSIGDVGHWCFALRFNVRDVRRSRSECPNNRGVLSRL